MFTQAHDHSWSIYGALQANLHCVLSPECHSFSICTMESNWKVLKYEAIINTCSGTPRWLGYAMALTRGQAGKWLMIILPVLNLSLPCVWDHDMLVEVLETDELLDTTQNYSHFSSLTQSGPRAMVSFCLDIRNQAYSECIV